MDWRASGGPGEVDPRLALRLRYYKLEQAHRNGLTNCDICGNTWKKSEAVEMWKGEACVFVACLQCLSAPLQVALYPDGLHIDHREMEGAGVIRKADSVLPSNTRPGLQQGHASTQGKPGNTNKSGRR